MTTTLEQGIAIANALAKVYAERPSRLYRPGRTHDLDGNPIDERDNGHLQFHKSQHVIRFCASANGWGKSTVLAVEIDYVGHGDHPYCAQFRNCNKPRVMVFVAKKHQQFQILAPKLEQWWPETVRHSWKGSPDFRYRWPDGSVMYILTSESDPLSFQGIEPDAVFADENPPHAIWKELLKRRRGQTKTRFSVAATQTEGLNWAYREIYLPWKKWHEDHGILDEQEMMRVQSHRWEGMEDVPGIWLWPSGSHALNPAATKESWMFFLRNTPGSPAERKVRLYGGWRSFSSQPVFDLEAIESMRQHVIAGQKGCIIEEES